MYTSGSTGVPKGIAVPHRAISRLVLGTDYICIAPGDRLAQLASPSFDAATFELWGALLNGASLVIIDRDTLLSSQSFATALREKRITSAFVTTALFNRLVRDVPDVFAPVRDLLFGGEAADPEAVRTVLAADPPRRLIHVYGPTEATTFSTWLHVRKVAADARTVPIGGPLANSACHVLDRWLQPVPTGAAGELHLGGDGLAHGYWGRPALTAERFIPDPFGAPGSRLYRSGDRVRRLPDASIEYLTRLDGQVKIRGYRIELGEIEAALRTHAAVEQVAVVARDSAGGKRLVAYVVDKSGTATGDLQRHLKQRLPDYMVPAAVVSLDRLPLTPNGKLDRNALPSSDAATGQQVTPRTAVEEILSGLWCDVLQGARPGIDDNFFDCGGHSLIAAQLMARIADAFSIELPLRTLFEAPTVRALALRVEEARHRGEGLLVPPLTRRPRRSPLPLSYAQEPLWFLEQVGLVGAAYNMAGALRLDGCLDAMSLAQSFGDVVRRHENLRTRFALVDRHGAQVIDEAAGGEEPAFRLEIVDLSTLPALQRDAEARRLAAEHARNPFDLRSGPLLRAKLLRLDERAHLLLINMHHIVADGWSVGVLLKELGNRYAAHVAGDPSPLPELPVQYADYAVWQREWLAGDILARHLDYWTSRLAGAPAALELPTDRPRPPAQTFAGATLPFSLPGDLSLRLAELGRREGATIYMVFLAVLSVLLGRHAGQDDIVIGSPVAGRSRRELEELTGMFVNMLVMRNDLTGNPTFRELLKRVRETTLGAYAHQDLPFEKLVDVLQPERDLSRQPLCQVCLAFENIGFEGLTLPGLSVTRQESEGANLTAKFDLTLFVHETPSGIAGAIEYATDLFDSDTIERLITHFERLLEAAAGDSDARILDIPLLTEAEHSRLTVEWNATATRCPHDRCLHDLFAEQAARRPDAVAVQFNDQQLSYRELDRRANRLAHYLRARGVGPDMVVGICLERSLDTIVGLIGILKAGGAYLPLDPSYPAERLATMMADAQAVLVVTQAALAGQLSADECPQVHLDGDWPQIEREPATAPDSDAGPDHLAYVIYTSGSTGRPKGVAVTHSNVPRLVQGANYIEIDADDVLLHIAPLAFDASTFEIWGALLNGARLVIYPDRFVDLGLLHGIIADAGVSILWLTTGLFHQLVDDDMSVLGPLRYLLTGGEVLSTRHVRRALQHLGSCGLINAYGPTEATTFSTCHPVRAEDADGRIPIGRPISNTRIYVLDPRFEPVPVGVPGELYVGGAGLARGYLGRAALTAERFVPNPFAVGERLYRTGDHVCWRPDGTLDFLGRLDTQVKIRGFRIEPGEIEAALLAHPAIDQAGGRPTARRLCGRSRQGRARQLRPAQPSAAEPARLHGPGRLRGTRPPAAQAERQARRSGTAGA
jgi:amino acid adenylation domain-containing protein